METTETKKQIFIAEDDLMVLDIYKQVLGSHGYSTIEAHDGQEAIDMLSSMQTPPALLLLDIMMPRVTGFELLKFIKSKDALRDIPVMFVTNLSAPEHIKKGLELGADKFLVKSENDPQKVVSVVTELLAKQ